MALFILQVHTVRTVLLLASSSSYCRSLYSTCNTLKRDWFFPAFLVVLDIDRARLSKLVDTVRSKFARLISFSLYFNYERFCSLFLNFSLF